jgi:hypothetical protein
MSRFSIGGMRPPSQIGNSFPNVHKSTGHFKPSTNSFGPSILDQKRWTTTLISFVDQSKNLKVEDKFTVPGDHTLQSAQQTQAFPLLKSIGRSDQEALDVTNSAKDPNDARVITLKKGDFLYAFAGHTGNREKSSFWMTEKEMIEHLKRFGDFQGASNPNSSVPMEGAHDPKQGTESFALPGSNTAIHVMCAEVTADCQAVATEVGRAQSEVTYIDVNTGLPSGPKLNTDRLGGAEQITPESGKLKHIGQMTKEDIGALMMKEYSDYSVNKNGFPSE